MEQPLTNCTYGMYRKYDSLCEDCANICSKLDKMGANEKLQCSSICSITKKIITSSASSTIQITTSAITTSKNGLWGLIILPIIVIAAVILFVLWRKGKLKKICPKSEPGARSARLNCRKAGNQNGQTPAAGNHNDHTPADTGSHDSTSQGGHPPHEEHSGSERDALLGISGSVPTQNGHLPPLGGHPPHAEHSESERFQNAIYTKKNDNEDNEESAIISRHPTPEEASTSERETLLDISGSAKSKINKRPKKLTEDRSVTAPLNSEVIKSKDLKDHTRRSTEPIESKGASPSTEFKDIKVFEGVSEGVLKEKDLKKELQYDGPATSDPVCVTPQTDESPNTPITQALVEVGGEDDKPADAPITQALVEVGGEDDKPSDAETNVAEHETNEKSNSTEHGANGGNQ